MDSTVSFQVVLHAVYAAIDEINGQLPRAQRLEKQPSTIVLGEGGTLDSLGAIQLVVAVEEQVAASVGQDVDLMDGDLLSRADSPLRSVDSLARFVVEKLSE